MAEVRLVFSCNAIYLEPYPAWLTRPAEIDGYAVDHRIAIDRHASPLQAELFLLELFYGLDGFTGDCGDDIRTLLREMVDGLVVSGGVVFSDGEREIVPGCCSGVEQWRAVYEDVRRGEVPFLGHDPFPVITYAGERVTVWQDDWIGAFGGPPRERPPAPGIVYPREELLQKLLALGELQLRGFLTGPFRERVHTLAPDMASELLAAVMQSMYLEP